MRTLLPWLTTLTAGALVWLGAPSPAGAQSSGVQVHGFGSLVTGRTDGYHFRDVSDRAAAGSALLAVHVGSQLTQRLRVATQVHLARHDAATDTHFDMLLAEWTFSPAAKLRVGQVPHPFGISTQVFDVGTLRPFLTLPQSVYGAAGFVAEGVRGVGMSGERALGRWEVAYDAYAGGMETPHAEYGLDYVRGGEDGLAAHDEGDHLRAVHGLVGGRVVVRTPVDGLSVGASMYSGREGDDGRSVRATATGAQAEYLVGAWSVRGEAVIERERDSKVTAGYAEVAYRLTDHWQAAAQFDALRNSLPDVGALGQSPLLRHESAGLGLNYWFSPSLVAKASYYRVAGNRFALPAAAELADAAAAGELRPRTHVVMAGAQLSF